ncbi:PoNe immunity protein domain-containing protein [Streptococcus pluranimalium]|uniref:PoNe immunity protein domain-containing protein n=1 Tax=Streptococcus pluranimalium TaxID=82348 RepID=UPI0015538CFD|nr:DUF1911 domain-containing protein [Streptococcus suis]
MLRDKQKDIEYFKSKNSLYIKNLETRLAKKHLIKDENRQNYYRNLVINYETLFKIGYSIGVETDNLFDYYKGCLIYLNQVAKEGVPFYRAVDVFALGVLYSERKEEFIDVLKSIYDQLTHTDGVIEYYMAYLFHDKIVPYRSVLEYQNMIGDDFDSVQKAQGFWYYEHSDAPWYETHHYDNRGYYGYWAFDTAATCKIKGIYDERLKNLDYFPYDLLVQE